MKRHIALIEDDEVIAGNYSDFLRMQGFAVDAYRTKESALGGLLADPPDLVLIDIMLNGERDAGFDICLEVRRRNPRMPIIFLSSYDADLDKVSGFRLGADDYISKDVSFDFLAIRIEALFRRIDSYRLPVSDAPARPADAVRDEPASLRFDARTSTVAWKGKTLALTLTQFWLLKDLHQSAGQPRTYAELMRAANLTVEPNTVSAHVKAIRQAFLEVDPAFDRIRTERGRGYRWLGF